MRTRKKSLVSIRNIMIFFILMLIISFFTYIWANLFALTIEANYFIPKQSSIFTFKETVHNNGSSDIWIYGEDSNNYYYNLATFNNDVLIFPKKNVAQCPRFNSEDINTWCGLQQPEKNS